VAASNSTSPPPSPDDPPSRLDARRPRHGRSRQHLLDPVGNQHHTGALGRRRAILRGPAWPGSQHTLTLAACAYPDIVALAELLASSTADTP
jgi:hypothetical protein